jgi:nucleotide-binding universal stress UspA family protein
MADHEFAGATHSAELLIGDPGTQIVGYAAGHGVDWICMATHGWSDIHRALIGGTAAKVVRTSSCPVLTAPRGARLAREPLGSAATAAPAAS